MATGGEVGEKTGDTQGSEDLDNLKCQPCQEDGGLREAVGLCTDCREYLCQRCFDIHCIPKPMKSHQLLDKQQMLESQIQLSRNDRCTERCPQHDDEFIKYYCKIHSQLSCSVCLDLNHRTCEGVLDIPDVASNLANNADYTQVEDKLASLLANSKKVATAVKRQSNAFNDSYARALKMMEDFRQEMNDAVDKIQTELRKDAAEMKSTKMQQFGIVTEKCEKTVKELQSKMTKLEAFRKSKQNCNLFTEIMKMKDTINSLDDKLKEVEEEWSVNECTIRFSPNYDILDTLKQNRSFGRLSVTDTIKHTRKAVGSNVVADTRTVVKAEHIQDINVKSTHNKRDCCISGSAILHNNKLIVCDFNNKSIKEVDTCINQAGVISQLGLASYAWDVAVIDDHLVAATLPVLRKVVFVIVDATLAVDREMPVRGECRGIDYKDGKLAVSFRCPDHVKLMDLEGTVLRDITNEMVDDPFYLAFSPAGTSLYVSNFGNHSVVCLNLDGTVTATYKDGALQCPRKVIVDRRGNIYVCGQSSNNLHQLTPDCKKIRVLLTKADGLWKLFSVSFSEIENELFMGSEGNTIKMCKAFLETN